MYAYIHEALGSKAVGVLGLVGFGLRFFLRGFGVGFFSGLLGRTGLAPYASMDAFSAAVYMPHVGNKLPRHSRWWISEDTLRFHVYQLAVELLHHVTRPLSISARCTVHNYFACRWHQISTLLVWQEAWNMLQQPQRTEYIQRTYDIDAQFGASMVDFAYAVQLGSQGGLQVMD